MEAFGESAVRRDADRFAAGGVVDAVGVFVPIAFAQAQPVHATAGLTVALDVWSQVLEVVLANLLERGGRLRIGIERREMKSELRLRLLALLASAVALAATLGSGPYWPG